jgi:ferric-dicitrate binding protein FerR (iron transport regulator)
VSNKCKAAQMDYNSKIIYIHKFLCGELKNNDLALFRAWLDASEENKVLFEQIEKIWKNADQHVVFPEFNAQKAYVKHKKLIESEELTTSTRKNNIFTLPKIIKSIAAIFILVVGSIFVFNYFNHVETFHANGVERVVLADGSQVWLEDQAELKFKITRKSREAELSGKAYFDVSPSAEKPFFIKGDMVDVRVVGTKFIVDDGVVFVKDGKVEVASNNKKVVLHKNQKVILQDNKFSAVVDEKFEDKHLWFNEELIFNNTPFNQVMDDVSKAFKVTFILPTNRDWSKCTFTSGSLKNNTLEEILTTLKLTYEFDIVALGDAKYKISKVVCK